jgi:MFS family permease
MVGPMLGPVVGGMIVGYLNWRVIFFLNIPIGILGLVLVYLRLPDYRENKSQPLDLVGLILFGAGISLLSYVLEVFGEHALSNREIAGLLVIALALIGGYGLHATRTHFPLLRLSLFRIRTFSTAVLGSFITRLGIGGVPFLLPLLYQVGLGFSPIQSGLLIAPQALASMTSKAIISRILRLVGYRGMLTVNTVLVGAVLMLFATIGVDTPIWLIVIQAFCYGGLASMQYSSMNTLVYADITPSQTSSASSIASTMQQMAISFGVAAAGLCTAIFVPDRFHTDPVAMIHGVHKAFIVLGVFTMLSSATFWRLKSGDGGSVSQKKARLAARPPEGG